MPQPRRNVISHRISYDRLAGAGAAVGVLAALVMAAVAMIVTPLVDADTDLWSFFKVVGTIVLGTGAADPLTGWEALPVLVGMAMHLLIGAVVGAVFAVLVGLFDIEDTVPVMLMGLVYGVAVFLTSYVGIGNLVFPAFERLPTIVGFWTHIAFGIIAGAVLGSWAERYDLDRPDTADDEPATTPLRRAS